jgi:hypothetical protein
MLIGATIQMDTVVALQKRGLFLGKTQVLWAGTSNYA